MSSNEEQVKGPAAAGRGAQVESFDRPHVVIDGVAIEANRTTLTPAEVARVMRIADSEVRNMIRRGELEDISCDDASISTR